LRFIEAGLLMPSVSEGCEAKFPKARKGSRFDRVDVKQSGPVASAIAHRERMTHGKGTASRLTLAPTLLRVLLANRANSPVMFQEGPFNRQCEPTSSGARKSSIGLKGMTDHLFLPEKEELDKILRCEAMINRELNHAIAELERLQTRRKGENDRGTDFTKQSQEAL
jgi:hypothetical protein